MDRTKRLLAHWSGSKSRLYSPDSASSVHQSTLRTPLSRRGSWLIASACGFNIALSALAGGRRSSPGCDGTGHAGLPLRPSGTPCSGRERRPSRQSSQPSRATSSETSVRPHRAEPECERSWPCCTPAREAEASPRWPSSTGTTDGPIDRILALFDPLLRRAPLIVEGHHPLGWTAQVRHQEPDTRIEFARVPLDLGHDPAGAGPSLGLVAEAGVETPDLVGRTPHRALEQVRDLALENSIGGQADHIAVVLSFQEFVDLRRGKTRIGSEIAPLHRGPVTGDDRLQHLTPALGGVDVAGPQSAAFQVAELVEHEQRVIAGAAEVPVVGGSFLPAVGRAHAGVHVQHDPFHGSAGVNAVDPVPTQVRQSG